MNHVKPTQEELDENINKAIEALDQEDQEEEEFVEEKKEEIEQPIVEEEEKEEEEELDETEEEEKKEVEVKDEDEIVYKKKFIESSREGQILHAKNQKMLEAYDSAEKIAEPTEEEMRQEYPDWDDLSDFDKKLAVKTTLSSRRFAAIGQVAKEFRDLDAWQKTISEFVDDPTTVTKYPELDGKEDEFKMFALKPSRKGAPMEDIVNSFLYVSSANRKQNKGQMFERGTGGSNEKIKPKSNKISTEESIKLRKVNYPLYKQYLAAGRIDDSSL